MQSAAVGVKNACTPAPAARMRSASVPAERSPVPVGLWRIVFRRRCRRARQLQISLRTWAGGEQLGDRSVVSAAGVHHQRQIARALFGEALHQRDRRAGTGARRKGMVALSCIPTAPGPGLGRICRSCVVPGSPSAWHRWLGAGRAAASPTRDPAMSSGEGVRPAGLDLCCQIPWLPHRPVMSDPLDRAIVHPVGTVGHAS